MLTIFFGEIGIAALLLSSGKFVAAAMMLGVFYATLIGD